MPKKSACARHHQSPVDHQPGLVATADNSEGPSCNKATPPVANKTEAAVRKFNALPLKRVSKSGTTITASAVKNADCPLERNGGYEKEQFDVKSHNG